jgi:hypothetical protein
LLLCTNHSLLSNQLPNIFPENITLEEVTAAVKEHKFFKRIDWGSYITFDYDNTHFPMMHYKQVFQQPSRAADPHTKRLWQILRLLIMTLIDI